MWKPTRLSFGEGRDARDAVRHAPKLLNTSYTHLLDADLSGYLDTIPHAGAS